VRAERVFPSCAHQATVRRSGRCRLLQVLGWGKPGVQPVLFTTFMLLCWGLKIPQKNP